MKKGKLYLIPTPLGENAVHTIPAYVIDILHRLDFFIAEKAKTARHFIKNTHPKKAFDQLTFYEINLRTEEQEWRTYLDHAEYGKDIGLLSEAGCPGVADPGGQIVALAHLKNIEVIPLVGPSSILLALMASGMNGQSFCFHGYLSAKKPELANDLKRLENLSTRYRQTQIFIETPYRNNSLIEEVLKSLNPNTHFCIAADLTLESQFIKNLKIKDWQKMQIPDFNKRPAIFLIQS